MLNQFSRTQLLLGEEGMKKLAGARENQGISNIEITDPSIKEFEKIARKYGVDYAVKKDRSSSPPNTFAYEVNMCFFRLNRISVVLD